MQLFVRTLSRDAIIRHRSSEHVFERRKKLIVENSMDSMSNWYYSPTLHSGNLNSSLVDSSFLFPSLLPFHTQQGFGTFHAEFTP